MTIAAATSKTSKRILLSYFLKINPRPIKVMNNMKIDCISTSSLYAYSSSKNLLYPMRDAAFSLIQNDAMNGQIFDLRISFC